MAALATIPWNNARDVSARPNILADGIALLVRTLPSSGGTADVTLPPMWRIRPRAKLAKSTRSRHPSETPVSLRPQSLVIIRPSRDQLGGLRDFKDFWPPGLGAWPSINEFLDNAHWRKFPIQK
jgi:hypothetical protein